jgi:hypothetical protein
MTTQVARIIIAFVAGAVLHPAHAENPPTAAAAANAAEPQNSPAGLSLQPGTRFALDSRTAVITKADTLPFVASDYSRRFHFDSSDNPKLKELRERYHLDQVVASGRDEFDRQIQLMDWVHERFTKFGHPSAECRGALEILQAIDAGHTFFCAQYAQLLVSAAASLGWIDRPLALRRHQGVAKVGGSTEHSVTEIWSNQYRKWVMLDPTSNLYLEKDGVPLNAFEIRREWFRASGANLVFVIGKERKKYRKADLPIVLRRFENFGDLAINPDELDKYGFIGFIPNTNLMDAGYDYGSMFIIQDELCAGTSWHKRTIPAHPAVDPYFPLGQAAIDLQPSGPNLSAKLKTMTPNFARFESRVGTSAWTPATAELLWPLHTGANRLEVRTVNQFGVEGPISTIEVEVN